MNSSPTFLARVTPEPIFIGPYRKDELPSSRVEPATGDIATLHTAHDSSQIKISSASSRTYSGEVLAIGDRRTFEPREVAGITFAEFTYGEIVAFISPACSNQPQS